jgi:glycosyltransferase involved in cell wall biosynthesis
MKIIYVVVEDRDFLNQRLNLALAAKKAGHSVVIASNKSELSSKITDYGFSYRDTKISRKERNLFLELKAIIRLIRIFKQEKPDVVHNISIKPVLYGSIAARLSGIPKIVNLINGLGYVYTDSLSLKRRLLRYFISSFYFLALRFSGANVIFQNPDDRDYFLKKKLVSNKKSFVILGSGVDVSWFSPKKNWVDTGSPIILYCGRMLWEKGLLYLIDAVKKLKDDGLQFSLIFVGEPDPDNSGSIDLLDLYRWQNDGLVDYLGYHSDVLEIIRSSSIVVLPTYYREGIPLSLIESASVGKPIIATDMPGCREIVVNGSNGFLVPPRDSVAIYEKLKILILDGELRQKMGECSRSRAVRMFSKEIVNRETLALYRV